MNTYKEQTFSLPALKGISQKSIDEHLKLYAGYVKHVNLINERITEYSTDPEKHGYAINELRRRFAFEFSGIRNHEYYFRSLEGGGRSFDAESALGRAVSLQFGTFESWKASFETLALTRGIGWAMLYWDRNDRRLINAWVDEQHLGQLPECSIILALDMWEHSFVADYQPSGKKHYVADFFSNLNWGVTEQNFNAAK